MVDVDNVEVRVVVGTLPLTGLTSTVSLVVAGPVAVDMVDVDNVEVR